MGYPTPSSTLQRVQQLKLSNDNEALPSQQLEIYPKLGLLFGKDLSKSYVAPAFQIPSPPATPQKQKRIGRSSDTHLLSNVTKSNITPRSTSINNNSNSPVVHDIEVPSRLINKRSQDGRKIGLCEPNNPFANSVDGEISDEENEFFRNLPSQIPRIVLLGLLPFSKTVKVWNLIKQSILPLCYGENVVRKYVVRIRSTMLAIYWLMKWDMGRQSQPLHLC